MTVTSSSDSDDGDEGTGDDDDDIEGKSHQLSSTTRIKNNEQVKNILSKYNGDGMYCTHGDDKRDVNGKKEKRTITIRRDHVSVSDTVTDDISDIVDDVTPISREDEEDLVKGVEEEANEELRTLLAQKRGVRSEKKKNPKIFARMTPDAKETVTECLHSVGRLCFMCGDGANDVGALKQADVGVALLSGFGDLNVDRGEDSHKKKKARKDNIPTAIISQEHLAAIRALPIPLLKMKIRSIGVDPSKYPDLIEKEDLVKLYQIKSREIAVKRHNEKNSNTAKKMSKAELQAKVRADAAEKQQKVIARAAELEAKGEKWATFKAMREFYSHEVEESKKKKRAHGTIEGSASVLAAQFEEVESGELPMVKIGDASVAAPFTSKMPSIQSCVDIVRQGCWKLKAKMEQNDTQTKPSGQVDYDERLKAKMMGENIRSSNTDNDFNKMGNQRPTQLGATAQPGAVAGTLDNAFERRLKAKLQEREQPSNPKTSSKADEYDKRIKAKLQENEQARKPKTTKRVDDYDRRLKDKMQQNEEALRTNKGIDASRSKINERVDYDTKLKEKMMKENRNSSVLDKNYDEMGKHQPDPADNYYESKFFTLVSSTQMYQILALNCLISSYSLSVLYLDGVKYGVTQITAMGMLGTISYMSVSRSTPLDRLSKVANNSE